MNQDLSLIHRLGDSVEILATGKGDTRSRLKIVAPTLLPIEKSALPKKFHKNWAWIWKTLSKYEPEWKYDNRINASLRRIKNSTGQKIAKIIFNIWKSVINIT